MTPDELVKNLQNTYGKNYRDEPEIVRDEAVGWIRKEAARYGNDHLESVFDQVTLDHSLSYKDVKLPDKAMLERAAEKVRPYHDPNRLPDRPALEAPKGEATPAQIAAFEADMKKFRDEKGGGA